LVRTLRRGGCLLQGFVAGEDEAVLPAAAMVDLAWEGYWSLTQLFGGDHRLSPAQKQAQVTNLRTLLGSLELIIGEI